MTLDTNEAGNLEGPAAGSFPPDDSVPPERAPPERIGRYALRFELASGGMGSVYLARMEGVSGFDKLVALKRIHPHLAKEKDYVDMFLDEAKIASRITHPNVCSVFDYGEANGDYFIAMEYLVGEPLSRVCGRISKDPEQRRDPLLPLRMARIFADACEGLHAAHELKNAHGDSLRVVHRDVSPRNLFITYDGGVQVVDFGIASARERLHQTSTGEVKGTFAYMAPEQIIGGKVDRRIDIWALGVALWETLAVKRLFKRDSTANTMYAVLHDEIEPPSKFRPQVPKELDAIVLKALARDPSERWGTAREMGRALRRYLGGQPEIVGAPELFDWMRELFPQGEARKSQLMEIARLADKNVATIPARDDTERTFAATTLTGEPLLVDGPPSRSSALAMLAVSAAVIAGLALALSHKEPGDTGEILALSEAQQQSIAPATPRPAATLTRAPKKRATAPSRESNAGSQSTSETEAIAPTATKTAPKRTRKTASRKTRAASKRSASPKPQATVEPGTVNLVTRGGWAEVFKDGKSLGSTPQRLALPPGKHKLVLKPFGDGAAKPVYVSVESGKTKQVSIRLD
ncbi:MAG: serine/threonine protein kinase [Polyangiales bacterium]